MGILFALFRMTFGRTYIITEPGGRMHLLPC